MNYLLEAIRRYFATMEVIELPAMIVGFDYDAYVQRLEIPFKIYVRKGRKDLAATRFKISEWAETSFGKFGLTDLHVLIKEPEQTQDIIIIRRITCGEISVTNFTNSAISKDSVRVMGTGNLELRLH